MKQMILNLTEDDRQSLESAAEVAGVSVEDFITEEILDIADLVNIKGDFKHVTLAGIDMLKTLNSSSISTK